MHTIIIYNKNNLSLVKPWTSLKLKKNSSFQQKSEIWHTKRTNTVGSTKDKVSLVLTNILLQKMWTIWVIALLHFQMLTIRRSQNKVMCASISKELIMEGLLAFLTRINITSVLVSGYQTISNRTEQAGSLESNMENLNSHNWSVIALCGSLSM